MRNKYDWNGAGAEQEIVVQISQLHLTMMYAVTLQECNNSIYAPCTGRLVQLDKAKKGMGGKKEGLA